jgi:hypothetical protein
MEIVSSYDESVNYDSLDLTHIPMNGEIWIEMEKITTKVLQSTPKVVINKISSQGFITK